MNFQGIRQIIEDLSHYTRYQEIATVERKKVELGPRKNKQNIQEIFANGEIKFKETELRKKHGDRNYDAIKALCAAETPSTKTPALDEYNDQLTELGIIIHHQRNNTRAIDNLSSIESPSPVLISIKNFDQFENFINANINDFDFDKDNDWLKEILFGRDLSSGFFAAINQHRAQPEARILDLQNLEVYLPRFLLLLDQLESKGFEIGNEYIKEKVENARASLARGELEAFLEYQHISRLASEFRLTALSFKLSSRLLPINLDMHKIKQTSASILSSIRKLSKNQRFLDLTKKIVTEKIEIEEKNRQEDIEKLELLLKSKELSHDKEKKINEEISSWYKYLVILARTKEDLLAYSVK